MVFDLFLANSGFLYRNQVFEKNLVSNIAI